MEKYIESHAIIIVLSIILACFMAWHGKLDAVLASIIGAGMAFPVSADVIKLLVNR